MFEYPWPDKIILHFKWACTAELITCILLYLIAMPIKYEFDIWYQMIPIGSLHGAAFTWYLILVYFVKDKLNWDDEDLVLVGLAAFFPFATYFVEKNMMNNTSE